ncbi:hypothetical protein Tco_1358142, partial [Tanacetum coccineum]
GVTDAVMVQDVLSNIKRSDSKLVRRCRPKKCEQFRGVESIVPGRILIVKKEIAFPPIPRNSLADNPIIFEGTIEGYQVQRIYVDGGSSLEIMYEHCFKNFDANIRSKVKETQNTSGRILGRSISSVRSHRPQRGHRGTRKKMELITLDLACPSTHQLLRNFGSDSGPDLSFDKSTSLERLFSLAHVSLAELGDEGSRSEGTKLFQIFIKAEKTPSPSSAFIKENIDVLRTMIKEHDQQAKIKVMPRRLAYSDSDKEAPARSLARGFSDRFSLESSGTSDTHRQTRSASKSQRTPFKNKELARLKRSRSSDSEYEEGSKDMYEDLNSPYKRPKPTPFTQRITRFKYHRRANLPRNIRVHEGNKDLEDHLAEEICQRPYRDSRHQEKTERRLASFHGLVQIRKFTHKGSSSGPTYLSFYAWSWSSGTRQKS